LIDPFLGSEVVNFIVIIILLVVFTWVGLNVITHDENDAGWKVIVAELG